MSGHHIRGFLFALATGVSWGLVGPIAKELVALGVNMVTVVFLRAVIVTIVLGIAMCLRNGAGELLKVSRRHFLMLSLSGFFVICCAGGGFLLSLAYLSLPVGLILHYAFPLITMLGSVMILAEYPTKMQILSGFLVLVGLWIGMFSSSDSAPISMLGVFWGLVAVGGMAGQSILGRYLSRPDNGRELNSNVILFYTFLTGMIFMGAIKFFVIGMEDIPAILTNGKKLLFVSLQAVFGNLLSYWSYFLSLRYISANAASLPCTSEIVMGMAIGALWFGAIPSFNEVMGATVIILAIGLSALSRSGKDKSAPIPREA